MAIILPLLLWVAIIISWISALWLLVLGFKRHWGWGVALCLPQIARVFWLFSLYGGHKINPAAGTSLEIVGFVICLIFLVVAWPETKPPFLWWLTSLFLFAFFGFMVVQSGQPVSPHVARLMRSLGVERIKFERFDMRFQPSRPGSRSPGMPSWRPQNEGTVSMPTPPPVFRSKLPAPQAPAGQRESAQPGVYYLLQRVSTKTSKGVQNGLPGEKVILLERLPGSKMRVTVGDADFVVHSSQVTDDVNVARELEKQDFVARGGQL